MRSCLFAVSPHSLSPSCLMLSIFSIGGTVTCLSSERSTVDLRTYHFLLPHHDPSQVFKRSLRANHSLFFLCQHDVQSTVLSTVWACINVVQIFCKAGANSNVSVSREMYWRRSRLSFLMLFIYL